LREKGLVVKHMARGTRVKNPRSKGGGLRNIGYKITRLSNNGDKLCKLHGCLVLEKLTIGLNGNWNII